MKFKRICSLLLSTALVAAVPLAAAPAYAEAESQSYTYANAKITAGGYAESILYSSAAKGLAYARTDMGGIYRRDDSTGGKWKPLLDSRSLFDYSDYGCESLVTDPVSAGKVYAMVGMYSTDWLDTKGKKANAKILRSADRGETWQETVLPFKEGANQSGRNFERMAIDPNNTNILFTGTRNNGLWKSLDAGKTWAQVTSFTAKGDLADFSYIGDNIGISWVVFDKTSGKSGSASQTIYVGVANKAGENTIYITHDGGASWAPLSGQPTRLSDPMLSSSRTYEHLPFHAVLASNGIMYITYCNMSGPYNGDNGDIWKYNTKTGEWTDITPADKGLGTNDKRYFGYGGLAVSASDPNLLCAATFNEWNPDANIVRSTDGGKTWKSLWTFDSSHTPNRVNHYTMDYSQSPWLNWAKPTKDIETAQNPKLGWEIGNLSMDPFDNSTIMYGTGASVMKVTNLSALDTASGKAAVLVDADGIEQVVPTVLLSPESGDAHLLSCCADVGCFVHTDLSKSPSMPQCSGYTISSADMAQKKQSLIAHVGSSDNAFAVTQDGGKTWAAGTTCWKNAKGGTVAVSADGRSIVWAPAVDTANKTNPVSVTTNNGKTWAVCSGVPDGAQIISDRCNGACFYAYANGTVYSSTDGGQNFTTAASGLSKESIELRADARTQGSLWIAGGNADKEINGLWHSTDGGRTFAPVASVSKTYHIGFGKGKTADTQSLYLVGTVQGTYGIFRSDDNGQTWVRINDDQHQYGSVTCITGDPRIYGRVYFGTNGRGVLYGDIASTSSDDSLQAKVVLSNGSVKTVTKDDVVEIPISGTFRVNLSSSQKIDRLSYNTGNGNVLQTGTFCKWNGTSGAYSIYAHGKIGEAAGVYANGKLLFKAKLVARPLHSDTSVDFSLPVGKSYTFCVKPNTLPKNYTFLTANGTVLKTAAVKGRYPDKDGQYYCRITAVKPFSENVGVYCSIDGTSYKLFSIHCK